MNDYEIVTAFADSIRKKCSNGDNNVEYAAAFGRLTGELDAMMWKVPGVKEYLKERLEREK